MPRHAAAPLPMRDGVAPSYLWLPEGHWPDMLSFLVARFPIGAAWRDRMARGEVVDGDGAVPAEPLQARPAHVLLPRAGAPETPIPFKEEILHLDEHLVVVDKPHFLPVIPAGRFLHETLLVRLKKSWARKT
jgi:tRNA pseudouridine32 synthase/23S rRNA pseudouridine746 synthase